MPPVSRAYFGEVGESASFRPSGGDFGGNLVNIEEVCVLLLKPIYSGKQIVDTSLPHLTFQKCNQGFRGVQAGMTGFRSQLLRQCSCQRNGFHSLSPA